MRPISMPRAVRGFTAVELMIVVVIVAILTAMAGPWMGHMVRAQRLRTASFDVLASLQLARSEAIKRNLAVTMAPIGANWATGWTITDANANLLKRQGSTDTTTITGPTTVVFNGTGRLNGAVAPFSLVSDVGSGQGVQYRCITVDLSGRAVSKEAAC
jgi:type IV fimbrial biogenesis protein FimT